MWTPIFFITFLPKTALSLFSQRLTLYATWFQVQQTIVLLNDLWPVSQSFSLSFKCLFHSGPLAASPYAQVALPWRLHFQKLCHCDKSVITCSCTHTHAYTQTHTHSQSKRLTGIMRSNWIVKWEQMEGFKRRKNWVDRLIDRYSSSNVDALFFGFKCSQSPSTTHPSSLCVLPFISPSCLCSFFCGTFPAERYTSPWADNRKLNYHLQKREPPIIDNNQLTKTQTSSQLF